MSDLALSSRALFRTGIAALPFFGLLKVHGADAATFLQAQLTNDVATLAAGAARLAGYCSVKGRLTASFWIWRDAGDTPVYWLACSRDIAAAVAKRLGMFVLRAKVRVEDVSDSHLVLGLVAAGDDPLPEPPATADVALPGPVTLPPVVIGEAQAAALRQAGVPDASPQRLARGLAVVPSVAQEAGAGAAGAGQPATGAATIAAADWLALEALSGVARIDAGNQDLFVPQMVNFELVDGVSFRKGCYPGQEVVARTQYLGKLKRRMYLAVGEGPAPASGADVEQAGADGKAEPAGQVVLAAPLADSGRFLVLFEARIDAAGVPWEEVAADAPPLRVAGSPLSRVPLPYPVPAPAAKPPPR